MPKTYTIIQLIKCGHSNDEIVAKLPDETVGNIRTVRTRFKKGAYEVSVRRIHTCRPW